MVVFLKKYSDNMGKEIGAEVWRRMRNVTTSILFSHNIVITGYCVWKTQS
jgi:hypothetical protein